MHFAKLSTASCPSRVSQIEIKSFPLNKAPGRVKILKSFYLFADDTNLLYMLTRI